MRHIRKLTIELSSETTQTVDPLITSEQTDSVCVSDMQGAAPASTRDSRRRDVHGQRWSPWMEVGRRGSIAATPRPGIINSAGNLEQGKYINKSRDNCYRCMPGVCVFVSSPFSSEECKIGMVGINWQTYATTDWFQMLRQL